MPHHHHYRHGRGNPICTAIYCTVLLVVLLVVFISSAEESDIAYFAPFIGIFIFVAISSIVAAIINVVRRKSLMQAQPVSTIASPQGYPQQGDFPPQAYPPQGAYPPQVYPPTSPTGATGPQEVAYNPATFQSVPQPRAVGIPQYKPPAQVLVNQPRFCKACGMPAEGADQLFCANCGAGL